MNIDQLILIMCSSTVLFALFISIVMWWAANKDDREKLDLYRDNRECGASEESIREREIRMADTPTSVFVDETGYPILCLCGVKYYSKELCCPRCKISHNN